MGVIRALEAVAFSGRYHDLCAVGLDQVDQAKGVIAFISQDSLVRDVFQQGFCLF